MSPLETRNVERDSLFVFAELKLEGREDTVRAKVRNLSAGGMMVDGSGIAVSCGDRLTATMRNIGEVKGTVAWVQGTRFGVAFDNTVEPKSVREPIVTGEKAPRYTRPVLDAPIFGDDERRIRKL